MDDEEDVKKMIQLLKSSREDNTQDYQFDDFINCGSSDAEENEEPLDYDENYEFCKLPNTDISMLNSYDPISTLKPDEKVVIESCTDPELKTLLLLNRTKNFQLMQLYKKLKDLLVQCQKSVIEKNETMSNFLKANKESRSSGAWRLAAPYFKDKKFFCCPPNADTIKKTKGKELCFYDTLIVIKWSSLECEKLMRAVKLNYNINQQNDVLKQIKKIKEKRKENKKIKSSNDELAELESRMEELKDENNSEIPPFRSDHFINWLRVSEVFLQDKRSSFECRSFWHIYLHPSINKSPWSPEENEKLKRLVKKYRFQNWDMVADELGNNRTSFTVCMNYYSNLHKRYKSGDFTIEENSLLVDLVQKHKMGNYIPWVKIVHHFKNRTRSQLHYRYTYYLSQNDKRKGKFTDAEDILLMLLVDRFGKNYKKCSQYLPTRSMVQIKSRYNANLQQKIKKGSFTIDEDEKILKYVDEHGEGSWTKLTKTLQRCRGQIRQRYNTIMAYLDKKPGSTLAAVPRRKHSITEEDDSFRFLRMIADQFQGSPHIPTLKEIENVLKNQENELDKGGVSEATGDMYKFRHPDKLFNIDDMLTNFFSNSYKLNSSKCINSKNVHKATEDIETVLGVLEAKLDIPDNFDEDMRLDNLDVAILNILSDRANKKNTNNNVTELFPPSLNNVVGLRSLLIKNSIKVLDKEKKKSVHSIIRSDIVKRLFCLSNETRKLVETDCKVFYERFQTLFKWPSILTLENPSAELQAACANDFRSVVIPVKRTYSKVDKNKTNQIQEKKIKITDLPSTSMKAVPLKLTPVTNKSIIDDLLRNKNKKLFSMEAMKCGKETKTIIKEIDIRSVFNKKLNGTDSHMKMSNNEVNDTKTNLSTVASTASKPSPEIKRCRASGRKLKSVFKPENGECIILDKPDVDHFMSEEPENNMDDEQDLKKLESFLKVEVDNGPNEDNDLEDLNKLQNFLKMQEDTKPDLI